MSINEKYYWNVLTTRLYYAVFLKAKEVLYDWYKDKHSSTIEKYFFSHEKICERIGNYVNENKKKIDDTNKSTLFNNISTLRRYRNQADYEDLIIEMNKDTIGDLLDNAEECIELLNQIQ